MKNWLRFTIGCWTNGTQWEERGYVYIDPSVVVSVQSIQSRSENCMGTGIMLNGGIHYSVQEMPDDVIARIQSASS